VCGGDGHGHAIGEAITMSRYLFEKRHMNAIADVLRNSLNLTDAKRHMAWLFSKSNPNYNHEKYWAWVGKHPSPPLNYEANDLYAALMLLFDGRSYEDCYNAAVAVLEQHAELQRHPT
jgi:hypothetical protein